MSNYNNDKIETAVAALHAGEEKSIRQAAKKYDVPYSTLRSRYLVLAQPAKVSQKSRQRLYVIQESILCDRIEELAENNLPPTHAVVKELAVEMMRENGDTRPLGKKWIQSFLKRNPRIITRMGTPIDGKRIEAADPKLVEEFYKLAKERVEFYGIKYQNMWNMDEMGTALGVCSNQVVFVNSDCKRALMKRNQNREWVSILECVSATGKVITPLVVFRGQGVMLNCFGVDVPQFMYTASDKGWTNNEIAKNWLEQVFIPNTLPESGDDWRLLLLDGHGSHVSHEFMTIAKQHRICCLYMPPHTSHILQPLDLSCLSPLKSRYRALLSHQATLNDSAPVNKRLFSQVYSQAREEKLTESVICAGWAAAGINPWNPEKGINNRFTQVTSRKRTRQPVDHSIPVLGPQDVYTRNEDILKGKELSAESRTKMITLRDTMIDYVGKNTAVMAILRKENESLKSTVDNMRVKKRRRVTVDPNAAFTAIHDIAAAQDIFQ